MTKASNSIAGFKLREGQSIGVKVTLRGDRMWEFLDRLVSVAIPRIRDFRGLPATAWDGRGNYTFGVNEQVIFPEIDYDRVDQARGMDITIVTTATTNEAGKALLDAYGFPFKREADDRSDRAEAAGTGQGCPVGEEEGPEDVEMAKKALINKQQAKPKFKVRGYTRCRRCGGRGPCTAKFGLCRICLRELAHAGEVPGLTKSSW